MTENGDGGRGGLLAAAVALRESGQRERARRELVALAAAWPEDAEVAYQTAWAHDVLGLEAEAVPYYERCLRLPGLRGEDRRGALLGLGSTLRVLGRYGAAVETLRQGVAEFPEDGGLRAFLAMALFNTGRHEECTRLLLRLVAATSTDPTVLEYRGAIEGYAEDLTGTV
ncbi:tetratricopeptide repeat protein [Streptomyces sp. NPDC050560]|uniref:tetratricopeptide repeat protein n=1 Tax=Streptomyces sp. NPDC050560 TaxID=3365630 RepID=UPI00379C299D